MSTSRQENEDYKMITFTSKEISKVTGINHDYVLNSLKKIAENKNYIVEYDYLGSAFVSEEIALSLAVNLVSMNLIEYIEEHQMLEVQAGFDNEEFEI